MTFDVKSGPHPHSQSKGGEVREVQFVIERECAVERPNPVELNPDEQFAVFVEWPPSRQEGSLETTCGPIAFRLTRPHPRVKHFPDDLGWVCEHMGRIIE